MDGIWGEVVGALKWLGAAFVAVLAWVYKSDRDKVSGKLESQGERIAAIEESRPRRSELTDAIAGLRHEVRTDIADLKSDVIARMDILIKLQQNDRGPHA